MTEVGGRVQPDSPGRGPGRVVVLGATGFVGRHVGAALEAAGHEILAVARRPLKTPPSWRFYPLDLVNGDPYVLTEIVEEERPVAVVNAAGEVWSSSPSRMRLGNQLLVDRMLTALTAARHRPRLVHLGSVHEYAPQREDVWLTECSPTEPTTDYGRTKLLGTRSVLEAARAGKAQAVVLRLSNVIGAGTPAGSLLGHVAGQLLATRPTEGPAEVRVSPLRSRRDFVDARDVSQAVVAALRTPAASGRVVNVASGVSQHVRHMVDLLITISGRPARLVERLGAGSRPATGTDWMGVDVSAARSVLGWAPRHTAGGMVNDLWRAACERTEHTAEWLR